MTITLIQFTFSDQPLKQVLKQAIYDSSIYQRSSPTSFSLESTSLQCWIHCPDVFSVDNKACVVITFGAITISQFFY